MYFDKSDDNEWKTIEYDELERIKTKKDGKTWVISEQFFNTFSTHPDSTTIYHVGDKSKEK